MARFFLTGILFFLIGCLNISQAQSTEYLLKAGFMERFTRFIEWPSDSIQSDTTKPFIILILGKNPFGENLKYVFSKTRIKDRKVLINYASKLDTTSYCHMIYIGNTTTRELRSILNYTQNKPIITVSETEGYGSQGVLINFFIENNKIRFEINPEAFRKSGLRVSHLLLNTAKII
jgi:hypothetical protein